MEVYFDNSATTKPKKEVIDCVTEVLTNNYGNPSSLHRMGLNAEKAVKNARTVIA
ncbi:MAG: aminotransferase class V-fold PLP-dependent enzyme, partial [Clostridia bacterium]|nr:aminotransferase class V-fold PLP-dependent enzyme [Clostridia bacterium]